MLEVTTHNLYFHEQSSIFSIDSYLDLLCTAGGDGVVRLWRVGVKNVDSSGRDSGKRDIGDSVKVEGTPTPYTPHTLPSIPIHTPLTHTLPIHTLKYYTALDSPTSINYLCDIHTHPKTVNCVRFNSNGLIASCSDGGKVLLSSTTGDLKTVRESDGVDCYSLVWGGDLLFIGTSLGTIEVYSIGDKIKKVENFKGHSDIVQGLAYANGLLVSVGKDNLTNLYIINSTGKLKSKDRINFTMYTNRGFYKRISFSLDNTLLFLVSSKKNSLIVLSHPFREEHVYCKIGSFDSEVVRVIESEYFFVVTKKSVYVYTKEFEYKCCVENISFKSTTDSTICKGVLFVSSLDGFISSVVSDRG